MIAVTPRLNQVIAITTRLGEAKVVGGNPLKGTVLVQLESEATLELPLSEIGSGQQ